ncbi:MAG: hypothetical protein P5700_20020 [Arthrospira platensis PCC 7345]|uniref:hypothetical protein n=1 Tax=Limnospira platensis TaxID=118562 RepID=UPI0028E0BC43|nr:hypothetical protein [Arthrospira platensis PCC 7345]
MSTSPQPPKYVSDLMELYGSSYGQLLDSGVFYDILEPEVDLEKVAFDHLRKFVGPKFFEPNELGWRRGWQLLYRRPEGEPGNIVKEFEDVYDILERVLERFLNPLGGNDYETAPLKLAIAFDSPEVTDLRIYQVHDEDILNGRLIISRRANGETTTLIFICD